MSQRMRHGGSFVAFDHSLDQRDCSLNGLEFFRGEPFHPAGEELVSARTTGLHELLAFSSECDARDPSVLWIDVPFHVAVVFEDRNDTRDGWGLDLFSSRKLTECDWLELLDRVERRDLRRGDSFDLLTQPAS